MSTNHERAAEASTAPGDFKEHLANLEKLGLLVRVDRAIDKDSASFTLWFVGSFRGG